MTFFDVNELLAVPDEEYEASRKCRASQFYLLPVSTCCRWFYYLFPCNGDFSFGELIIKFTSFWKRKNKDLDQIRPKRMVLYQPGRTREQAIHFCRIFLQVIIC